MEHTSTTSGAATATAAGTAPGAELVPDRVHAFWRAANYISAAQIYLLDNPLLTEPLSVDHLKPRLLGHWGTTPGLNLIYAHLDRLIVAHDLDMLCVTGPGHGGPATIASSWLEGSFSEHYPDMPRNGTGLARLVKRFSFPRGLPSHAGSAVPGSINEGGELGYSLVHAFGAAFDNPDLTVACIVGDGEAETGALAASWNSTAFLDPVGDGAVLPILHLNGWKIANPTILSRASDAELRQLFGAQGWTVEVVDARAWADDPAQVHRPLAEAFDRAVATIARIQSQARSGASGNRHRTPGDRLRWPMIVLRSPKGWTGPGEIDGRPVTGTWRSHQVPLGRVGSDPGHRAALEAWLRSYRPEELFGADGAPLPHVIGWLPQGQRRLGATPHANGGRLRRSLRLPPVAPFASPAPAPGQIDAEPTRALGRWLAEVFRSNAEARNFRLFGPDETASNRLDDVYAVTGKAWQLATEPLDEDLDRHGRVMEVLSEQLCQGWLEGYLLTGRHGLFSCYEAFVHVVDSMFNQHAKWLEECRNVPWRAPVSSLNYLLTSHVWRQDHNGFSHQDPGFVDLVANKKPEIVRVYLPPDVNCLLVTAERCLASQDLVNVIVSGKQPTPVWLDLDEARAHCHRGISVWPWAGRGGSNPQVVLAAAGDVPTVEALAAVDLLATLLPEVRVRFVNVVDLLRLQDETQHPHGMSDDAFDAIFGTDVPVIFAYHGYPWLIHRLAYRRRCHDQLHVRGYIEEGSTTTPFDMVVRNRLDRYHLVLDVIQRVPGLAASDRGRAVRQHLTDQLVRHVRYVTAHGEDLPEIRDWRWPRP